MPSRRLAAAAGLAVLYVGLPTLLFMHQSASRAAVTPWVNKLTIVSAILVFQPGIFVLFRLLSIHTLPAVQGHPLAFAAAIIVLSSALFWTITFYCVLIATRRYRERWRTSPSAPPRNPPPPSDVN